MPNSAKPKAKRALKAIGVYGLVRWLVKDLPPLSYDFYCGLINRRGWRFEAYLENHAVRKLHLGCGYHYLPGWFNTDLVANRQREKLNATGRYPFPGHTFDYIFSEHMIEHISYAQGQAMLAECFRVLKPGGTIRIVTPNLNFLFELYRGQPEISANYVRWSAKTFLADDVPHNTVSVINNFFYNWGHTYIYDAQALSDALAQAGFTNIVVCPLLESEHEALRGLENDSRMPPGFLALESMILEAQKSADAA